MPIKPLYIGFEEMVDGGDKYHLELNKPSDYIRVHSDIVGLQDEVGLSQKGINGLRKICPQLRISRHVLAKERNKLESLVDSVAPMQKTDVRFYFIFVLTMPYRGRASRACIVISSKVFSLWRATCHGLQPHRANCLSWYALYQIY